MRRGIDRAQTYALIDRLRSEIPGIALRTTLLTGYPDESEADFAELMEFVGRVRFERLGVFAYSEEEGTYSAQRLSDNVPEKTKRLRVERLMELQNGISRELNIQRLGTTERVIVDGREDGLLVARSQFDSPEVDTEILIRTPQELAPGTMCTVRITQADDYDLYATICDEI